MNLRWLITVLWVCAFGTTLNTAISIRNEYFAVKGRASKNRQSDYDESVDDELNTSIKITEMRVRSEISLRYASTSVISRVHNPGRWSQEYEFRMLLPETAFITGFTMILDGKSYKAYVKEKEEAKDIYDKAVSRGVGAAHVATEVRDSNHFTVSVNVEGNSTAIFDLRYEEFLVRHNKAYNHVINLYPGALVPIMEVVVHIKESQKIIKLRVPDPRTGNEIDANESNRQYSKAVIKKGKTRREVTIIFRPDLSEQERLAEIYKEKTRDKSSLNEYIGYRNDDEEDDEDRKVLGQFVVQYDVSRSNKDEILVNDGYFVHFLAPTSMPPLRKQVVFLLDTSSSMFGQKIVQLRSAMETILSELNPKDYFNIVEFNTHVKVHDLKEVDAPPSMFDYRFGDDFSAMPNSYTTTTPPAALATRINIAKAKVIISRLRATGATNIDDALNMAVNIIKWGSFEKDNADSTNQNLESNINVTTYYNETEKRKVEIDPVIIFLTDGDPTLGPTSTNDIISFFTERNGFGRRASLYSLAFGEEPDRSFLRQLSLRNEGFMRHIYEASDAALQLHDFYRQVSSPLLSHVKFLYPSQQVKEGSVSRNQFRTIHEGSEVAVVGQITDDATEITPRVQGYRSDDDGIGRKSYELTSTVSVNRTSGEYLPLERLWAYLSIKQLLEKVIAEEYHGSYEESPEKKAQDIALKYGFVTPLTSLVVVKFDEAQDVDVKTVDKSPSNVSHASEMYVMPPPAQPNVNNAYNGDNETNFYRVASNASHVYNTFVMPPPAQPSDKNIHTGDDTNSFRVDYATDMSTVVLIRSRKTGRGRGQHGMTIAAEQNLVVQGELHNYVEFTRNPGSVVASPLPGEKGSLGIPMVYNRPREKGSPGLPMVYNGPLNQESVAMTTKPMNRQKSDTLQVRVNNTDSDGYHLEDYGWTSSILERNSDSLVFEGNGTQIVLKLTKTVDPPKAVRDDVCFNSTPIRTVALARVKKSVSVCVYLTRCFAARAITVDDYKKSYCFVNDRYAGVCCPSSKVDRTVA